MPIAEPIITADATLTPGRRGGRFTAGVVCVVVTAVGLAFGILGVRNLWHKACIGWQAVPCTVLSSKVTDVHDAEEDRYVFEVSYKYSFKDREYSGIRYTPLYAGSDDYTSALRLADWLRPGIQTHCFVNPSHPLSSVLRRGSLADLPVALVPLLLAVAGGAGLYYLRISRAGVARSAPLSGAVAAKRAPWAIVALFGAVFLLGAGLLFFRFLPRMFEFLQSRSWTPARCIVERSRVQRHETEDGPTYGLHILYRYDFGGRTYKSSRYQFIDSLGTYKSSQRLANRFPAQQAAECYVNPSDPYLAVIHRRFTWDLLLGIIPLAMAFGSLYGILACIRWMRRRGAEAPMWLDRPGEISVAILRPPATGRTSPITLRPAHSPVAEFAIILVVCLFWNGVLSGFIVAAVRAWQRGHGSAMPAWPLIFPGLMGLLTIVLAVRGFLALFNPRITLVVSHAALRLGESGTIQWHFNGRYERIGRLKIAIEGREEAFSGGGASRPQQMRMVFHHLDLLDTTHVLDMQDGSRKFSLPTETMHSLNGRYNKVIWSIRVNADIPRWPNLKDEFAYTILPQAAKEVVA